MFCGGLGHTATNCTKASLVAVKLKAWATQVKKKDYPSRDLKKKKNLSSPQASTQVEDSFYASTKVV